MYQVAMSASFMMGRHMSPRSSFYYQQRLQTADFQHMPFMQTQHFQRAKALVTEQKGESIRLPVNDACIKKSNVDACRLQSKLDY